jgi:glycerol-3-phosphate acyltransferase PlsY
MLLGVSLPITCWVVNASNTLIIFATVLAFFNLWNHRTNIQRLQEGTESRFGSHKK